VIHIFINNIWPYGNNFKIISGRKALFRGASGNEEGGQKKKGP